MSFKTNKKLILYLGLYILVDILLKVIYNYHILNEHILKDYFLNEFSSSMAEEKIERANDNVLLGYFLGELLVVAKLLIITSLVKAGAILLNFPNLTFRKLLFVVVVSHFVFFIPALVQILWFSFFVESYTVEGLKAFNWHTLLYWVKDIDYNFLKYPLSLINLFEILFWFCLILLIKRVGVVSFWSSLKLFFYTYGLGLLIWMVFVMFLIVTIS